MRLTRHEFLGGLVRAFWGSLWVSAGGITTGCGPGRGQSRVPQPEDVAARAAVDPAFVPGYVWLHRSGELRARAAELRSWMRRCRLCPRRCGANRLAGEAGFCRSDHRLKIASHHSHYGEERPLVGSGGSGTIFFSNCNVRCVFCINWRINHLGMGTHEEVNDLARRMLDLQLKGCHNINLVTPTHYSPFILEALDRAASWGLRLPLVYNTSGWERVEVLRRLDGVVDIYLPDFKYWDPQNAARYSSGASSYPEVTKKAILEMYRQVGTARPAADGLIYRGLMIRHLVLPNGVAGTREVLRWIATHLPKDTWVTLMSQYRPVYRADRYPTINRRITREEYAEAVGWAREYGLTNVAIQPYARL
ncbi:MAG: radical SAM protein [Acidobacteriota bacterium]